MPLARTIAAVFFAACVSEAARGYRPFDSTDADVAAPGDIEIELGPFAYLEEGTERRLIAPAVVADLGLPYGRELVFQGAVQRTLGETQHAGAKTTLQDAGVFMKQLLRAGALQERNGPSVATEYGLLLPTLHGEPGTGASNAGIASDHWGRTTVHLNLALAITRSHQHDAFAGFVVEGSPWRSMRPVMEIYSERTSGGATTRSALAGVIRRVDDRLSLDVGIRSARADGLGVRELRAGLTFSLDRSAVSPSR